MLEIVEGTYQLMKIEVKDLLSPLKLSFKYYGDNVKNNTPNGYLYVIHSKTNPKPELNNCQGHAENPKTLTILATDERKF